MDRLGPPDELSDQLRRAHQTRRRALLAVGGSVWQGLEAGMTGYLKAFVLLLPVMFIVMSIVQLTSSLDGGPDTPIAFLVNVPIVLCAGAWMAGRRIVEAYAERSWRREDRVRGAVAVCGTVPIALAALLVPADHVWLSVVATSAIPFAFAIGALTAGGRRDGPPWIEKHWPARLPSPGVSLLVFVFGGVAIAIAIGSLGTSLQGSLESTDDGLNAPAIPAIERWRALGFDTVAPRIEEADNLGHGLDDYQRDGWVVAELPDDVVDWDAWANLRLEAWPATFPRNGDGEQFLASPDAGPYLVVPVPDPWRTPRIAVNVGQPGVEAYLLFLIADDPATGERVALGFPGGDGVTFHGNLLDWFGSL